jgi:rhamnosyltransferase
MMAFYKNVALVLPTWNPGQLFDVWIDAFNKLNGKPGIVSVVDSGSTDDTQNKARQAGFAITVIDKDNFDHGTTRQFAVENSVNYEFIVFMTQDAILSDPDSFKNLLSAFEDNSVAAVCGRQVPRLDAGCIESHSRIYNYPDQSSVRKLEDRKTMGIKAAFLSNSFAAYRISSLLDVGGFPDDVIFGEDMYVAAKLLMTGGKIAYAADACVYHSHNYSMLQEFGRYFDMGVFHAREPWIREKLGSAENKGLEFVISELKYLSHHAVWRIPEALIRDVIRFAGFRAGLCESVIPRCIKRHMSMNQRYFEN